MSEEKKHLIISIVLWAAVIALAGGGIWAIGRSGLRGGLREPGASSEVSSEVSSEPMSIPESSREESGREVSSEPEKPVSREPSSAPESAAPSSESVSSQYVDATGATAVSLFGGGASVALTPEQIAEFMALYGTVSVLPSGAEAPAGGSGEAGFAITYQDGRKEGYTIGQVYDGLWYSGGGAYDTGTTAYDLEAYMCRYPVVSNWLNQAAAASAETASSEPQSAE